MTGSHSQQESNAARDRRTLTQVLLINLAQCVVGIAVGVWASSTALLGSALDNLADAAVYGVSLYAVGRAARVKVLAARISGWLLVALAVLLLIEVGRRFWGSEAPLGVAMIVMAAANAAVNLVCLKLLARHRGGDVNFKASAVFTSNDSLVNLSIVASGILVMWLGSNVPDLVLGIVVAGIAAMGGREILEEALKAEQESVSTKRE
ncbi:MAG: cation transporter [Burkholderiales bacterium]|nr:cation transporter [Burkholderiales bacterium]